MSKITMTPILYIQPRTSMASTQTLPNTIRYEVKTVRWLGFGQRGLAFVRNTGRGVHKTCQRLPQHRHCTFNLALPWPPLKHYQTRFVMK